MASWQDGPEYAPLERPAEFDAADVAPLDRAPAFVQPAANAPADRPWFDGPAVAQAPLAQLVPADDGPRRDPHDPFDVATGTLTEGSSAWSAARGALPGSGPVSPLQGGSPVQPSWGPPTGDPVTAPGPWPAPDQPMLLTSSAPAPQNGFAAPGSNAWFGYPAPQRPPAPRLQPGPGLLFRAVTPAVVITLGVGILLGLATSIVPLTYVVAWVLASRIRVARKPVLRSFLISAGVGVFLWLIRLVTAIFTGDATYTGFELLSRTIWWFSWVQLIVVGVLVFRGLSRGERPDQTRGTGSGPYPPNSPWG